MMTTRQAEGDGGSLGREKERESLINLSLQQHTRSMIDAILFIYFM